MKKTFVIVDPFSTGALLAPELAKHGHRVFGVLSSAKVSNYFTSSYTGKGLVNTELLTVETLKKCVKSVDGVLIGAESGVTCGEALANYYGVKSNSPTTNQLRRDKWCMQQALLSHGLNAIPSWEVDAHNYANVLESLIDDCQYVLKPKSSACTDGVRFFDNKVMLADYLQQGELWESQNLFGQKNESYLLQQYIKGKEYIVDMVVKEEQVFIAALSSYEKGNSSNSPFVYRSLDVLDPCDDQYKSIIDYATQCAQALGVTYGCAHMELFETTDKRPVMIEVGARLHGGIAPLLFKQCYENDLLSTVVNLYVDNMLPPIASAIQIKKGKIIFLFNEKEGSYLNDVTSFQNKIAQLPCFKGMKLFFEQSQKIPRTTDLTNLPGIVWLAGDKREDLNKQEQEVRNIFNQYLA